MEITLNRSDTAEAAACGAIVEAAAGLRSTIRDCQDETQRERRMPVAIVEQFRRAGFYRMLVPRELGGLQVDPLTYFRVIELMAEGDGSAGWNIANHAVGALSTLSLPDEGVREVLGPNGDGVSAGTIGPGSGRAVPVEGGYRVTGRWPFGSGCDEADWMTGTFHVFDGDEPRRNPDGRPAFWKGWFRAADCAIIDNWDVIGMQGTGSHDWTVSDLFVPDHLTTRLLRMPIINQWSRWSGTLYALPTHVLIGAHHSSVATGIARASIDALTELAGAKVPRGRPDLLREQAQVQEWVGRAEALLGAARAYRTAVTVDVWDTMAAGRPATLEQVARCRLAASHAVDAAMEATDLMYRAGGTTSTQRGQVLARCWCDVHVVGQAVGVRPEWYPMGGRVFLGMDPGPRLA